MANTNAPFGFRYFGRLEGGSPTAGLDTRYLASDYNTAIGYGDAVIPLDSGFIAVATASSVPLAGIFMGCEYYSTAVNRKVWSYNFPGSGQSGVVKAYISSDPQALWLAQAATTPITFADINLNAQLVAGTVNSLTGMSTMAVNSTAANTATHPFRIVGLYSQYVGQNTVPGSDDASNYNWVVLAGNNWQRTNTTGI